MSARRVAPVIWAVAMALAAVYLATHWRLSTGVTAFLPQDRGVAATLLQREARGAGPAGAILALLSPQDAGAGSVAAVIARLRDNPRFALVAAGPADLAAGGEQLFRYRYLLSPRVTPSLFTVSRLREALESLVAQLRDPAGAADPDRLAADPTGEWRYLLERWFAGGASGGGKASGWRTPHGRRIVLALPRAGTYALDAQAEAVRAVRAAAAAAGFEAELAGAPAIAVATRNTVRTEARWVSLWAAAGVLAVLLASLRPRWRVFACLLPVATAVLTGMVAVHALFGSLHGITLAFGATLLGLTTDYPVHLLGHGGGFAAARRVRRPLLLGLVSTALGFSALALSGLDGLAQLAVFAVTGLLAAGATTLTVLPALAARGSALGGWTARVARAPGSQRLGWGLGAVLVVGATVSLPRLALEPQLAALSPVPQALRERDEQARAQLGLAGARHLLVIRAAEQDTVLRATEAAATVLERRGFRRYQAVTRVLPSRATQRRRQQALPQTDTLRERLEAAAEGLPVRVDALAPFLRAVAQSRALDPLTPARLGDGAIAAWLSGLLFRERGQWYSLIRLDQTLAPASMSVIRDAVGPAGASVTAVDLQAAMERAVARYQRHVVGYSLLGAAGIVVLLFAGLAGWRARLRTVLVTLAGVAGALMWLAFGAATLSLFHLASLLLVAGLALDYGLFTGAGREGTASTTVCALSTVIAFAALASASTPVLHDIGTTVVAGAVAAWLVAWLSQPRDDDAGWRR